MYLALVFVMGLFRVAQSVNNKNVSIYTNTTRQAMKFGVLFEAAASAFSLAYLFITGFGGIHFGTLLCAAAMGIGFVAELLTALAALKRAPLGLCTLCALGGAVILPAVAGVFFYDEPLTPIQWGGIVLFFVAAWLLTPKDSGTASFSLRKSLPILFADFLLNGGLTLMSKYYGSSVKDSNPALFSCWAYGIAAVTFAILLFVTKKKKDTATVAFPKKVYLIGGLQGAVCSTIVFLTVFLSIYVPIVIVNTIPSAICITGSVFIGGIFFKEKLTSKHLLGALFSVISIAMTLSLHTMLG